jgi:hypothetical protein
MFGRFWRTPRKTAARRWIFQIHFYAGLIAGLLWTVVGATGSAIVFVPELRRFEVPGWTRVRPVGQALPLEPLREIGLPKAPSQESIGRAEFDSPVDDFAGVVRHVQINPSMRIDPLDLRKFARQPFRRP